MDTHIPSFGEFSKLVENGNSSHKNYKNYLKGGEPLKVGVLSHPHGEDKIYNFIQSKLRRVFWLTPRSNYDKAQNAIKNNKTE